MKRKPLFFSILISVLLLDQLTKYATAAFIHPLEPVEVLPFFNLVNMRNIGAAFGLFASMGNTFFIAVALLALVLLVYLIVKEEEGLVGFTLILAGALGNLIDRLLFGYVRDFMDFHAGSYHWPAFNVADSALTVGIALVLAGAFIKKK